MKWLQWSYLDVEKGLGGVEVHMRSLHRELNNLGVEAHLSSNPADLQSGSWDVIHTHGSNLLLGAELKARLKKKSPSGSALWVHTLHGLTHERMIACGEFFWPGGYRAVMRELAGTLTADVLLSIHPALSIFKLLGRTRKKTAICGNGWNPWTESAEVSLKPEIQEKLKSLGEFWVFIGRGDDRMKGVELLLPALNRLTDFKLVAIPGSGFENIPAVTRIGPMNSAQIRTILSQARGLILPSRYEGLPLVVLEALAEGVPVVTSRAGGLKTLSADLQGLFQMDFPDSDAIVKAVKAATILSVEPAARQIRAQHNRRLLSTWRDVAQKALAAVNEVLSGRPHSRQS